MLITPGSRGVGSTELRLLPTTSAFDAPLGESPSEYRDEVWYGKTRMVWLADGKKILKIMLIRFDRIHERDGTDTQTPHDSTGRTYIPSCRKI